MAARKITRALRQRGDFCALFRSLNHAPTGQSRSELTDADAAGPDPTAHHGWQEVVDESSGHK